MRSVTSHDAVGSSAHDDELLLCGGGAGAVLCDDGWRATSRWRSSALAVHGCGVELRAEHVRDLEPRGEQPALPTESREARAIRSGRVFFSFDHWNC